MTFSKNTRSSFVQRALSFLFLPLLLTASENLYAQTAEQKPLDRYRWGMTMDQVKRLTDHRLISEKEDELFYMLPSDDESSASVSFDFMNERLNSITYSVTIVDDEDMLEDNYKEQKSSLTAAFGDPVDEAEEADELPTVSWFSDSTRIVLSTLIKESVMVMYSDVSVNDLNKWMQPGASVTVFKDEFDDNSKTWSLRNDDQTKSVIEDGSLKVSHSGDGGIAFWQTIAIDSTKDFTILCRSKWTDGEDYGYGIDWSHADWENEGEFMISSEGSVKVVDERQGDDAHTSWVTSNAVNKKGENTLKIKKRGSLITYFVNNEKILVSRFRGFAGDKMGVIVYGNQRVEFDNFEVSTSEPDRVENEIDALKPQFGKLTIYYPALSQGYLDIVITPDLTIDELKAQLDGITGGGPAPFGKNTGHTGRIQGSMKVVEGCLPINDFYDGTNGNGGITIRPNVMEGQDGVAAGPFAGTNWNNSTHFNPPALSDCYYCVALPYRKYKLNFTKYASDGTVLATGEMEIEVNSSCMTVPITDN